MNRLPRKDLDKNILVFCSHPDDLDISMGGSVAKFSKEGNNIVVVIFSYGELSHLKEEIIKTKREREARNSGRVLGYNDIQFFGLPDSKISSKIEEMGIKDKIKELIIKYKPIKVFTHNPSDPMPDHNAVNSVVIKAIKELKTRIPLYGFDVWNLYNLKERDRPLYFVDISDTFWTKVKALSMFKTQLHVMLYFLPIVFLRAKFAGRKNHCKYAERFYRLL